MMGPTSFFSKKKESTVVALSRLISATHTHKQGQGERWEPYLSHTHTQREGQEPGSTATGPGGQRQAVQLRRGDEQPHPFADQAETGCDGQGEGDQAMRCQCQRRWWWWHSSRGWKPKGSAGRRHRWAQVTISSSHPTPPNRIGSVGNEGLISLSLFPILRSKHWIWFPSLHIPIPGAISHNPNAT